MKQQAWAWQDETQIDERLLAVTIDDDDNIYVAGSVGATNASSLMTGASIALKLDGSTGKELWRHNTETIDHSVAIYNSIAIDNSQGMVIAAGTTAGIWEPLTSSAGGNDFAATALNSTTGEELGRWQAGTIKQDDLAFARFDSAGAVFMGGASLGSWDSAVSSADDEAADIVVVKYASSSSSTSMAVPLRESEPETFNIVVGVVGAAAALALVAFIACE